MVAWERMMQVSEFKAWFEGFTEDMTKLPTVKQWARIKARIDEIDGVATTWMGLTAGTQTVSTNLQRDASCNYVGLSAHPGLNANYAFTMLGKAEAASIAA